MFCGRGRAQSRFVHEFGLVGENRLLLEPIHVICLAAEDPREAVPKAWSEVLRRQS